MLTQVADGVSELVPVNWNYPMKYFNRYQDIVISYNEKRERWFPDLRALGVVPPRPMFKTKAEASDCAREAFERWQNRDVALKNPRSPTLPLKSA